MISKNKNLIWIFLGVLPVYGQNSVEEVFVNQGSIVVSEGALVATSYAFDNTKEGVVETDGVIYYFNAFNNDNLYYHSKGSKSSMTYFSQQEGVQVLGGNRPSEFYSIQFEKGSLDTGFDLQTAFYINGEADFSKGIVKVDPSTGILTFLNDSKVIQVSDQSHAEGEVEKIGKQGFQYPIGDKNFFRPASISAPKEVEDVIVTQYYLEDHAFFDTHKITSGVIHTLNEKEYWRLEGKLKSSKNIVLSLSWDDRTTPPELLKDPENELHIVRWDANKQLWVDEGGVVDMSSKRITTVSEIKDFGYFTLATVKKDWVLDGDVVIYNLVTPDGDGKNDYFIIDNIKKYPNNRVEIYNRWGIKVYETTNYDPLGDGSTNVFTGYSEGKITVDKSKKLPSGTYYYIVTYEYTDANGSRMIKKAANLHLETN